MPYSALCASSCAAPLGLFGAITFMIGKFGFGILASLGQLVANTDGTAIFMTMAVLFIAQALDIPLSLGQQLTILFVMLFTSKGAAGVARRVRRTRRDNADARDPAGGRPHVAARSRAPLCRRSVTNLFSNIFATIVVSRWMSELDQAGLNTALVDEGPELSEERTNAIQMIHAEGVS